MTKNQLLAWFSQAAPGDRIRYFRGDLATLRGNVYTRSAREIIELADAARELGMPKAYVVQVNYHNYGVPHFGKGLAHLSQHRITTGSYEYFITKATAPVLA